MVFTSHAGAISELCVIANGPVISHASGSESAMISLAVIGFGRTGFEVAAGREVGIGGRVLAIGRATNHAVTINEVMRMSEPHFL